MEIKKTIRPSSQAKNDQETTGFIRVLLASYLAGKNDQETTGFIRVFACELARKQNDQETTGFIRGFACEVGGRIFLFFHKSGSPRGGPPSLEVPGPRGGPSLPSPVPRASQTSLTKDYNRNLHQSGVWDSQSGVTAPYSSRSPEFAPYSSTESGV